MCLSKGGGGEEIIIEVSSAQNDFLHYDTAKQKYSRSRAPTFCCNNAAVMTAINILAGAELLGLHGVEPPICFCE
jgi:hypothetical protein